jgi:hypothetical protein
MLRATSKPVLRTLSLRFETAYIRANSTSGDTPAQNVAHVISTSRRGDQQPTNGDAGESIQTNKMTTAQVDDEMKRAMAGLAGDGGEAGIELEGGQPVAMKRSVRENMFRYI